VNSFYTILASVLAPPTGRAAIREMSGYSHRASSLAIRQTLHTPKHLPAYGAMAIWLMLAACHLSHDSSVCEVSREI